VRAAQHVVAGSFAGVAEHSFMFPLDTMKTIMQVRNAPAGAGGSAPAMAAYEGFVMPAFAQMAEQQGMRRLWRGVQTMFTGCIPAHGAYFTIYESCKPVFGQWLTGEAHGPAAAEAGGGAAASAAAAAAPVPPREAALAAGAAVALGTMVHDLVMTPMDVCKQRLQLGYHKNSVYDCACAIMRQEGARAFVLSYPTTLIMNVPYALVMGTTNEALRNAIDPSGRLSVGGYFAAGATAGIVAAAATNPLDVVKTRLQTQHLALQDRGAAAGSAAAGSAAGSAARAAAGAAADAAAGAAAAAPPHVCARAPLAYTGMMQAIVAIFREEGLRGFSRGVQARMLIHAPSVAICWTTYESIKSMLQKLGYF